ncbi:MAG: hypothetical protein M0R70_01015 [Nitrospirae bacterium]|nr:hypothetical protein [Nitrospirota bacterium]
MRLEDLRDRFIGTLVFPFTSLLMNRRGINRMHRAFLGSEHYSVEQAREIQLIKMRRMITHVDAWVPYYTKKFKTLGFAPGDIKTLEDIKAIPPVSRQDVIDHHRDMVDKRLRSSVEKADARTRGPGEPIPFAFFRRHKLVRNTSSGSTGAPTVFYEDGSTTARNWALELRLKSWYGVGPGAREARMARLSTAYDPASTQLKLRSALWNQLVLPGVNLTDRDCEDSLHRLAAFKPKVLWGFTSALTALASYAQKSGKAALLPRIQLVIAWAAPLYDHEKELLREVFQCPVTNIYGAREVGHIAAICPEGSFHINDESLYVETAGPNDGATEGEILVTTLEDSPMPFIRYRTGDLGRISESNCACGRTLRVFDSLLGRTGEVFITKDGRMISPNFWCRTFMDRKLAGAVERFQVVYQSPESMKIRIVKGSTYTEKTEEHLKAHLKNNFHSSMKTQFEYVGEIEPQISGKYQMVIKESR